jgi:hypothetical protein
MTGARDGDGQHHDRPDSEGRDGGASAADDEAHLAALLAVLAVAGTGRRADGTPLQQWRARRLAALRSSTSSEDLRSHRR